ncbi:hypothetical protein [Pseudomonas sp. URMO17WK12:I11]|uniref:hypothetical protein n=1 Tax=Pseudomonas sp. URMO17WK12:I11 TaxID=1283291 RepID=UPI0018D9B3EE|nr:hypothetical protein [Pseudomonas sp. URMO17WK12:I11]MBH3363735.1 hypothetical protein [Pseudomonas sp. URMO17WK12:I11]
MQVEVVVHQVLKKILLVVLGSGLLGSAMYLYGISFYEGLVKSLGFEILMFPVKWEDGRLWTYIASREIGVSTVNMWVKITAPHMLLLMIILYVIVRLWIEINHKDKRQVKVSKGPRRVVLKFLVRLRRMVPKIFLVVRWLMITEQSLWAFLASYFAFIFVVFCPLLIVIWVYFPAFGINYGEAIGKRMLKRFETELCYEADERWSLCLDFPTSHISDRGLPSHVEGRVLVKNDNTVGLFTKYGPLTMTLPEHLYQITKENPCWNNGCKDKPK